MKFGDELFFIISRLRDAQEVCSPRGIKLHLQNGTRLNMVRFNLRSFLQQFQIERNILPKESSRRIILMSVP